MKRLLKALARRAWRMTGPVRRPLDRKFEEKVSALVAARVRDETHARFDLLLHVMNTARHEANSHRGEANLALDALVREVSRLQFQVEDLQHVLAEADDPSRRLGLVEDAA